jgi:hypothetical protein
MLFSLQISFLSLLHSCKQQPMKGDGGANNLPGSGPTRPKSKDLIGAKIGEFKLKKFLD